MICRKLLVLGVCMLAGAVLAATPLVAKTVKVGVVLTYSGGAAVLGEQVQRGMDLYMDMEGREKLGDHTIEFVRRDSRNPGGDVAKTAVQELIVNEEVDLLAGFIFSPNIIASVPLIERSRTPTMIMNAGTAWITNLTPYVARVSFSMWHAGYPMGEYAANEMGCRTAAVGYTDYPPGRDSRDAFAMNFEANGGEVVDDIPMGGPAQVPDFTPFMQRVKDASPDCFYVFVPAGPHVAAVFRTFNALDMRDAGIKLIGPADLTQDTELQGIGSESAGHIVMGHYQADLDNEVNGAFVQAWKNKYGQDSTPDFMSVAGYDGMAAIVEAIVQQDGEIDPDRTMEIWKGWQHDSPRGPIRIDPATRDIVQDIKAFRIQTRNGRIHMETVDRVEDVKDPCKANNIGRCGE